MVHILVLEDDADLNQAVCIHLQKRGYEVTSCLDVKSCYEQMEKVHFDVILSDIMLPKESGFDFAREVRLSDPEIPIIFMTAYDSMDSIREGYELGIDDYMVKPVNLDELVFRIQAILRRAHIASKKSLVLGNLELNEEAYTAKVDGKLIPVTLREFKLLFLLLSYPGRPFSRTQLIENYNGMDSESTPRSVDVFIAGLRTKFADCDGFRIETVRGLGYKAVLL